MSEVRISVVSLFSISTVLGTAVNKSVIELFDCQELLNGVVLFLEFSISACNGPVFLVPLLKQ